MSESTDAERGASGPYRSARFQRSSDGEWTARREAAVTEAAPADAPAPAAPADAAAPAPAGRFDDLGLVEVEVDENPEPAPRPRRRRPHAPRMWLQGGTTTQQWGWVLIGSALIGLGAGLLASTAATQLIGGVLGGWIGTAALWVAMIVPVVYAYTRSVPRGLLRFRATDILFGVVAGLVLRTLSGWFEQAAIGTTPWPTLPSGASSLGGVDAVGDVIAPVLIGPLVEEFFFHGFLLIALYTVFRRLTRLPALAGSGAALVTTGVFVIMHQLTGSLSSSWYGAASIALVGLVGAVLVLVTGRIWGALLVHVVFNASYIVLALAGTALGVGGVLS